uniref:NADH-ubiquinone oxidoreductase chain 4 n=1 Tax=Lasioglossum xanthopus TaxID=1040548 RepID=A0A0S2LTV0_9HYME|nr:NADH dehydrogenase subunit 4 [Lasioglossum xanthopus]
MMTEILMIIFGLIIVFNKINKLSLVKNFISCILMLLSVKMFFKYYFFVNFSSLSVGIGLNNYSYVLIILTLWIFGLIFMFLNEKNNLLCVKMNMILLIILLMFFLSIQLFMFYLMFEISLIMIFFFIIKWGSGEKRLEAAYYMMFYTLFFSLPFLIFLFLVVNSLMVDLMVLMELMNFYMNDYFFMFMMGTFFVKIPLYMFHGWLIKAHVEAPVFGSMILASILLKLGTYGLLQMMIIFMGLFMNLKFYIIMVSLFGSIILSGVCLRQMDMKILVAYSSVVHMGVLISSMLTFFKISVIGGLMIMIAHGLSSSGLFYLVNVCYSETNSRLMLINKGMMNYMPKMSLMWFLMCTSNMSAPISLNLIGEILLLIGLVNWLEYMMFMLVLFCFLGVIYSLYLFCYIQHGEVNYYLKVTNKKMIDYIVLILHWLPLNLMFLNLLFFCLNSLNKNIELWFQSCLLTLNCVYINYL